MVRIVPYDRFRVSCDCGRTIYVSVGQAGEKVSCPGKDCNVSFRIDIETEIEEDETSVEDIPV